MNIAKRKATEDDVIADNIDELEDELRQHDEKRIKTQDASNGRDDSQFADRSKYKECSKEIEAGFIQRNFYPPEMTDERCHMYSTGQLERPIDTLQKAIASTQRAREAIQTKDAVVHWYKNDFRLLDNKSLSLASEKARKSGVPLICVYLVSPQDYIAHCTSAIRVDFNLRNLELMKQRLAELDIPLYIETIEKRKKLPGRLIELCREWNASHVYCNIEYEVDELRREAKLTVDCLAAGISFNAVHDTCMVEPGAIQSNSGSAISVYSPWFRKWVAHVNKHKESLKEYSLPCRNPPDARKKYALLFESAIPDAPDERSLTQEQKDRLRPLWPVGEEEAHSRLQKFIASQANKYHENRSIPSSNGTSMLSAHLAAGTLAARTLIREALRASKAKSITVDRGNGYMMWISEVAWRDFYKHVLAAWPFVCMNKCFKPEYTGIEWEYSTDNFRRWTEGRTGYPFVDAAMRQVQGMAYMHNRVRMVVASFLAKDLMLDWRMGEKWFMENLIDGDFASNSGGWGFSASCGVDPQPYFRIFNPTLQGEKFDEKGEYIRKWIPELRNIKGKAIHDPYNRGAAQEAKRMGYPEPIVEHKFARDRCLERYKRGIKRETA